MGDNVFNLQTLSQDLSVPIPERKGNYNCHLANKLNDPTSPPETYWEILKTIHNGNKIPLVPPIIVSDKLASDYEKKLIILIDSLFLDTHPLIMTLKSLTQLFSTQK